MPIQNIKLQTQGKSS